MKLGVGKGCLDRGRSVWKAAKQKNLQGGLRAGGKYSK